MRCANDHYCSFFNHGPVDGFCCISSYAIDCPGCERPPNPNPATGQTTYVAVSKIGTGGAQEFKGKPRLYSINH